MAQSTTSTSPWPGANPYLLGTDTIPGVLPEGARLYGLGGWNANKQSLANQQLQNLSNRNNQVTGAQGVANSALTGAFDPKLQAIDKANAMMVDPTKAFASLGGANPMGALQQMLTGQVDTSSLNPVVQNAFRRMGESFNEQALPNIRGAAVASGQYGSSRQGIAEGLAARDLANSMGDLSSNLYNQAYNQAQQQRYGTANQMAGLGVNTAEGNANRDLNAQNINIQSALDQNRQAMMNSAQQLANRQAGLGMYGVANSLNDTNYQQKQGLLNEPTNANWQNLSKYASLVQPSAGFGGVTTQNVDNGGNKATNYLGTGLGLLGSLGSTNIGGKSLLDQAWNYFSGSGSQSDNLNTAVNNLVDYSGLYS
jgi:hypothetical protein